jgi:hypothetical protein
MEVARDALPPKLRIYPGGEIAAGSRFSRVYNSRKIEPLTEESSDWPGSELPIVAYGQ